MTAQHGIHHTLLAKVPIDEQGLPIAPAFVVRLWWSDAVFLRGPFSSREDAQEWIDENEPRLNTAQPKEAQCLVTIQPLDDGRLIDAELRP